MTSQKPELLDKLNFVSSTIGLETPLWNWVSDPSISNPANYYEASLTPWTNSTSIVSDCTCDVIVVGGGLLGLSAALHLAESGYEVVVLEKNHIGSAASGRNGGQITPGLARWEAGDMLAQLSFDEAKRLWQFSSDEAMALINDITERYGFDIAHKKGHITAAVHSAHLSPLLEGVDARCALGDRNASVVGRHQLKDYLCSDYYAGGVIDKLAGQIHPLALVRGMAFGFASTGGKIFEKTEVVELEETTDGVVAITKEATVKALKGVVLAIHQSTFHLDPDAGGTTFPFYTYVGVTTPLKSGVIDKLIPSEMAVYDTQFSIDYYRPVHGNRLLFGGEGSGTCWHTQEVNDYLLSRLNTVFSGYGEFELDYSWSGVSDFTLNGATDSRKSEGKTPIYTVHGWSGHGVAQTVRIGKAICDDLTGQNDDFDMLAKIEHHDIPLGRQISPFAIPVMKAAMSVMKVVNPSKMISF
ncbi:NAD(P)/FAD-dependent oxidoreductase [Microbulbifer spongiae]|uniref:FAD-binding oxidoreductase n=1 Tax=Microbulbifer spongiae TaxID=2944933 RepID=A0ABY9EGE3_9GAMM|nr:FAD-dependent oxidoreductase [Microbulbifer sp. MI-G]WKD50465.1 FAD-binding oxidoreductase [Microbulbifer sp. MI-G]